MFGRRVVVTGLVLVSTATAAPAAAADGVLVGRSVGRSTAQDERPSCRAISYPGVSGRVDVQTFDSEEGPVVSWGVTMYDRRESIGRWDVDTFLNGKKTSSGFHRTTVVEYIPHGAVLARSGRRFTLEATLLSAEGNPHHSVTNECFVP